MRTIKTPLTLGQTGEEVANLQDILFELLGRQMLNASNTMNVNELAVEKEKMLFGSATVSLITDYIDQKFTENPVGPNDMLVNDEVIARLNTDVNSLTNIVTVRGSVSHIAGKRVASLYTIKLATPTVTGDPEIFLSVNSDDAGRFTTSYEIPAGEYDIYKDLVINVTKLGQTKVLSSKKFFNAGYNVEVDFTVDDISLEFLSEFDAVLDALTTAIDGVAELTDIDTTDDGRIQLLASKTGENPRLLVHMIEAHKLEETLGVAHIAAPLYGLLRQNFSTNLAVLLVQRPEIIAQALQISLAGDIIPQMTSPYTISSFSTSLPDWVATAFAGNLAAQSADETATFQIAENVLANEDKMKVFTFLSAAYIQANGKDADGEQDNRTFWQYVADESETYVLESRPTSGDIESLQAAGAIALLTGNNALLTNQIFDDWGDVDLGNHLAALNIDELVETFAANLDNDFPPFIKGTRAAQKQLYKKYLVNTVREMYPTQSLNQSIINDSEDWVGLPNLNSGFSAFLTNNADFDLKTVTAHELEQDFLQTEGPTQHDFTGIIAVEDFIAEVGIAQRLLALTTNHTLVAAMAKDALHSSMQISHMSEEEFVESYGLAAGGEAAAEDVYQAAVNKTAYNYMVLFDQAAVTRSTDRPFIGWTNVQNNAYAEWRNLFGSIDGCNCSHCQSVYSPAAYLTDLLTFLEKNTPLLYTALIARRPDIADIELTCKNINTPVPHLDIVNELLEDVVSYAAANGGAYKMFARQTLADSAVQRAIPEYINTKEVTVAEWDPSDKEYDTLTLSTPYQQLKEAIYPGSLPYNFYKRQIDTHLDLAGVKGYEMMQRFSAKDPLNVWKFQTAGDGASDFCAEYLGISKEVKDIIITNDSNPYRFYGFRVDGGNLKKIKDPSNKGADYPGVTVSQTLSITSNLDITAINSLSTWAEFISVRVDVFLQQTGLTYKELLEVLACWTINPSGSNNSRKMDIGSNKDAPVDIVTCDLAKLCIKGIDTAVIKKLYRFIRLKNALGWSFYDLDKAMISQDLLIGNVGSIDIDEAIFVKLVQIDRVARMLKIPVTEVALFWKNIEEVMSYTSYEGSDPKALPTEYIQIFRNPLTKDIDDNGYPFKVLSTGNLNPNATTPLISVQTLLNYLAGVLNISTAELTVIFNDLFQGTTFTNSIAQLSQLRRHVVIMKALKLKTTEWLQYKYWLTSSTTFGADNTTLFGNPYEVLRFLTFVNESKDAGVTVSELGNLLLDAFPDTETERKQNDQLEKVLNSLRAGVNKLALPAYDAGGDTDGKILESFLLRVVSQDKIAYAMQVISNVNSDPDDDTEIESFLLSELPFLAQTTIDTIVAGSGAPFYQEVYDELNVYIRKAIVHPYLVTTLSKEFKLDEDVSKELLTNCLTSTDSAFEVLLSADFLEEEAFPVKRWPAPSYPEFEDQFIVLIRLKKAAWLINKFKLDLNDVINFWRNNAVTGIFKLVDLPVASSSLTNLIPSTATVTFSQWLHFVRWTEVIAFVDKNNNKLYQTLSEIVVSPANNKADTLRGIATAFKISVEDVEVLLGPGTTPGNEGKLVIAFGSAYKAPATYLRLIDCLEMQHLLPSAMISLSNIADSVRNPGTQKEANGVIQVVKAQYDDKQWMEAIRPVNDKLRTERRDALVTYLLANPPAPYKNSWFTSLDIFETMMLDVDMMSCMATTRVLLAVNTVQLWVDRVLLGIESYSGNLLQLDKQKTRQWQTWRKLYRVWEANRKVFLYPENWIEPELRDGKTPFFIELEKFLKQNDLTEANVEDAYRTYLERLDEVAHLDVVAMCRETAQDYRSFTYEADVTKRDTLHVFGRTPENPHIYYYRKRLADEWTPWEKMDAQIDGDHFVPIMWRGRLKFFWLTFMKEQREDTASGTLSESKFTTPSPTRWKINLAWSEYKNGKWTAKQVSKDAIYSRYIMEEAPVSVEHNNFYEAEKYGENRNWNFRGDLEKIKNEYINFFGEFDGDNLRFRITEREYSSARDNMNDKINRSKFTLNWKIEELLEYYQKNDDYMGDVVFKTGYFTVKFNTVVAVNKDLATARSLYHDELNRTPNASLALYNNDYKIAQSSYWYYKNPQEGYSHYPDYNVKLLGYAPGAKKNESSKGFWGSTGNGNVGRTTFYKTDIIDREKSKYVLVPRQVPKGYTDGSKISIPHFFYKDYNNTFFVEKIITEDLTAAAVSIPLGGLGQQGGFSAIVPTYRFHNFNHDSVDEFQNKLFVDGLDGLLDRTFISDTIADKMAFYNTYAPTASVLRGANDVYYPHTKVDFTPEGASSIYNWELFFHIPMLIANKLMQDQKFAEARKWYQYVFDPTVGQASSAKDFWNFPEFYKAADHIPTLDEIMMSTDLANAVARWADNPFKPHLVARTRISAYMKNVVMKYLDNLIGWGDMLFRTDTRENINEATLLYVLAAQIMGRKPISIPSRATTGTYTYNMLFATGKLNAFSNALLKVENKSLQMTYGSFFTKPAKHPKLAHTLPKSMFYFCLPKNDKLAGYWDIIADRLFKIHHCQNIDGVERDLALYDPPIDPALLVKAAAAGISLSEALSDINAPIPHYRFNIMSQKATELTQEVKSLGGQLLSALEKKDAEHLALLRSSQELTMMDLVTEVKEQQVQDTVTQINGLQQQQKSTTQRRDYYKKLVDGGLNSGEQLQLESMQNGLPLALNQGVLQTLSGVLSAIPNITIGPFASGAMTGGGNLGPLIGGAASAVGTAGNIQSLIGSMAATKAGYARRKEDWDQQLKTAEIELKQIDHQILGAQIRKAVAELELRNHKVQVENARQMDTAMHEKFTNEDLYEWMVSEISITYFQAHKLAMDVAKRAERCYRHELGIESSSFIQPAYWDSLKKGLLAGEQLAYDIKRMEVSFLEKNKRHLELTKHISLATFLPDALTELKTNKVCNITLPEWFYDMDYPGQHLRRIKSVSISIPCVAGPYTTISCKLSLLKGKYRKTATRIAPGDWANYNENPEGSDTRFSYQFGNIQSIATSHAQNDSGMFEFSFRDERYLPFEGAGAISNWKIELPAAYAQFDYNSISDVILHVNYTALDEGGLKEVAKARVEEVLTDEAAEIGFFRLFNLPQEFATSWNAYGNAFNVNDKALFRVDLHEGQFPYYCRNRSISSINDVTFVMKLKDHIGTPPMSYILRAYYSQGDYYKDFVLAKDAGSDGDVIYRCSNNFLNGFTIEGNTRILKFALLNSAGDTPINMKAIIDELYMIWNAIIDAEELGEAGVDDENWNEYESESLPKLTTPTGLSVSAGNGQVTLSWSGVANATSYTVSVGGTVYSTNATSPLTITGLSNGTAKSLSVIATADGYQNSNAATISGTPHGGTLFTPSLLATEGDESVSLSWDMVQASNPVTYTVERSTDNFATPIPVYSGTGTSVVVSGLSNGVTYSFRVKATAVGYTDSGYGNRSALPNKGTLIAPVLSPTNGNASVSLSWNAVTAQNPVTYIVEYSIDSFVNDIHLAYSNTGTSCVVSSLNNGTTYQFRIRVTASGYIGSTYGSSVQGTPQAPSSGNSGNMPTSGLAAWWKADAGITNFPSGKISQWADQSSNDVHFAMSDEAYAPSAVSSSVNGIAPIGFNGAQKMLTAAFADTNSMTLVVLVNMNNNGTAGIVARPYTDANVTSWTLWGGQNTVAFLCADTNYNGSPDYADSMLHITPNEWTLLVFSRDASGPAGSLKFWKNGSVVKTEACATAFQPSNTAITLGVLDNSHYATMTVLETMVYNRALSDQEVLGMNGYLNSKYSMSFPTTL